MPQESLTRISLSVDELALAFSLINQADTGKSLLYNAYGSLTAASIEDKLTAASHTLLAREFVSITDQGAALLRDDIQTVLVPLIQFKNILQVTVNTNQDSGPEIINVYVGKNNHFTALRVRLGVVYSLIFGETRLLPGLIDEWLQLPAAAALAMPIVAGNTQVSMPAFMLLATQKGKITPGDWKKMGVSPEFGQIMVADYRSPLRRGTVVLTNMNSENYQKKNTDEAGAGFFYLVGQKNSWLLSFAKADEQTLATVQSGTSEAAAREVQTLLSLA